MSTDPSGPLSGLRTNRRTFIITIIGIIVLFAILFGWRSARFSAQPQADFAAVDVVAMVVTAQDVPSTLDAVGTFRAVSEVMLSPEVAGRVTAISFESGSNVRKGTALVQLYDAPEQADKAAAEARAKLAQTQLARSQRLAPSGAEPRRVLDERQAELDQAIAAVRQLDARITQKSIRAPFSGTLGVRRINPGQYLNPGDPIVTLTALDPLHIEFTLPQQNLSRLTAGSPVAITTDAWPGRNFVGKVNAVEPRVDEETRNITVQATVPNPDGALRPGLYATARLELPMQANTLVVPATAIQTSASGDSVTVIRGDQPQKGGPSEIVSVVTGQRIGNTVVISKGLKPGDVIITEGQLRIPPGAPVNVIRLLAGRLLAEDRK